MGAAHKPPELIAPVGERPRPPSLYRAGIDSARGMHMRGPLFFPHPFSLFAGHGFTLVESLVALAVAALLACAAAPSLQEAIEARRVDGAALQLAGDIQFARSEATARNRPVRVRFQSDRRGSCYVLHTGGARACECDPLRGSSACAGASDSHAIKTVGWPASDRIELSANVGSLLFDPLHGTTTPTGTLKIEGPRGRAVHHVVNIMGRVRSCSPAGRLTGYPTC